jgi:hypothetical protein
MERGTPGGTRRNALDADRFDQLAVSVSQAAPSRRSLLRRIGGGGLAAAIAALGGVSPLAKPGAAKKSGKKTRRRAICHRTSATDPGVTKKMKAKKAKKELKQHPFDTKGACSAAPPRVGCQTNADCSGGLACVNNICVNLSGGGGGTGGGGTGGGGGGTGGGGNGGGGGGGGGLLPLGGICVLDTECLSAFCNNTVLDVNGRGRCDSCIRVLCGAPNQRRCCGDLQVCSLTDPPICIDLGLGL